MQNHWNRFLCWTGWKKLFPLPFLAAAMLFSACCAGLVWVFLNALDMWWPSYILYCLSGYSLTALCIKIPGAVRKRRHWLAHHPKAAHILKDRERKLSLKLYLGQFINFGYGFLKLIFGVILGSAWIGADGIYNFAQALIQLFQILRRRKPGSIQRQWRSYRFCGGLILLMHLTLIGIVFQTVNWNRVGASGEIMMITTAAFAFYKFIFSFIDLAKDRKHTHPLDSSVRLLSLSQAIFAIFPLQAGLLHTFGTGESWEHWLNLAAGCIVCLQTVAIGIYMILRGSREIKIIQEKENAA